MTEQIIDTPEAAPEKVKLSRTLLETWYEVLTDGLALRDERISRNDAARILGRHGGLLELKDVGRYVEEYYKIIAACKDVLVEVIEADPECLNRVDDDAEKNHEAYLAVLGGWRRYFHETDKAWDFTSEHAAVELAAFIGAGAVIIGSEGIINHLSVIDFTYTDDDEAVVRAFAGEDA